MNHITWKSFLVAVLLGLGVSLGIGWLAGKFWADVLPRGVGTGLATGLGILAANLYLRRVRRG